MFPPKTVGKISEFLTVTWLVNSIIRTIFRSLDGKKETGSDDSNT